MTENNFSASEESAIKQPVAIDFSNIPFIENQTGKAFLPSLLTEEEEENFKIDRNFYLDGYQVLQDSVKRIQKYEISDQYNTVLGMMSDQDLYWLKFIGRFKSVQLLQIHRQTAIYPDLFTRHEHGADISLKKLLRLGLIMRWQYKREGFVRPIKIYTLTGNGYRFLEYFFSSVRKYFQPQNFWNLNPRFHIRFWETVDIFQLLLSLPIFNDRDYSTLFSGGPKKDEKILQSPLQMSLRLVPDLLQNLVFYPALQTDDDTYYKKAVAQWSKFTEDGTNLHKPINKLPKGQNVLAFYTPTVRVAERLNKNLSLPEFNFPIIFLVGSVIKKYGVTQAFYVPDRDANIPTLKQLSLPNLVQEY